jgi:hypothetical protein
MKKVILLCVFFASLFNNAQNGSTKTENTMGISCHEISISIGGIITVNNFYVCCGDGFTNNTTIPPTICQRVSKKLFEILQDAGARYSKSDGDIETPKISDLTSEDVSKITEIKVDKSSVMKINGKKYSIRTGVYKVEANGIINFEVIQLK